MNTNIISQMTTFMGSHKGYHDALMLVVLGCGGVVTELEYIIKGSDMEVYHTGIISFPPFKIGLWMSLVIGGYEYSGDNVVQMEISTKVEI